MRPSVILLTIVMAISTVVFGCDEKVYGASAAHAAQYRAVDVTPVATAIDVPRAPAVQPAATKSAMVAARRRKAEIQGHRRTLFAGAYWGWGFHEDGIRSARDVVDAIQALPVEAPAPAGVEPVGA